MDPGGTTILRVKRKRGTDPADALLLACKRIRAESSAAQPEAQPERIENSVFKLVATVASQVMLISPHANSLSNAIIIIIFIVSEPYTGREKYSFIKSRIIYSVRLVNTCESCAL